MSLEAALDEERREVMALLEGRSSKKSSSSSRPGGRASSPAIPTSPIRSMLDVGDSPPAPKRSPYRSMLDPASPRRTHSRSPGPASPGRGPTVDPEAAYKFEFMPTIEARSMPKRVTQGGKQEKARTLSSETQAAMKDPRHTWTGLVPKKGDSPGPSRSHSPGGRRLNNNSMNLMPTPNKYVTDSGEVVDLQNAYRRLSDGAMLRSTGTLSTLPIRKGSDAAPGGGTRLQTDDFGDDERAVQSSDDDDSSTGSSDGEGWGANNRRGRQRTRDEDDADKHGQKTPKSLLAAAEAERKDVSSSYKVRSLLEPAINITGPNGEKMSTNKKKGQIHPHTSYDAAGSGVSTPFSSDTEADISEMKAAQQLAMAISPIKSIPEAHRCVRQIVRGNYSKFQDDAEKGLRRQRVYLVATDLSEEAAYALEWTIGTVLRDGDTLLAVYAVDEETVGEEKGASAVPSSGGATAQQETDGLFKTLSNKDFDAGKGSQPNTVSASQSDPQTMGKAEKERYTACVEVSDRCVKLLRRTRLQVRVVVEVFHCKSPKHMITEVIDFLEPTLVILGSRGRSALKGVLLGSFSNYLVTKSSVPVMVARKRLRKHSKYKRKNLRLSNVLTNPTGRLANAKID
ncbi:hypothetical protein M011DRAFT_408206 [Sporormia fimetaria CBS 119925]|uniref:UspA domain-containing protein n=1 Tax=Sporormia fimetaria CBS 119925 TaxID=1340428 RepID=A0A6A6V4T3_9PLEO|nr:hypothetical protein M011DRAFT_408206 [Sporormia fimetaria CBS 119925]